MHLEPEVFERIVALAMERMPPAVLAGAQNVVVVVEPDVPPGEERLLGLYEGTPLPERDSWYTGTLPDRITLYRQPILDACNNLAEVIHEVRVTLMHEFAHHYGIDDDRLDELGWG